MRKFAILFLAVAMLAAMLPAGEAEACGGRFIGKARSGGRAVLRVVGRVVRPFR